jgi:anti-sigma regulatory factor (Ser/Thr protein kinase)
VTLMKEAPERLCLPPRLKSGATVRRALAAALAQLDAEPEESAGMLLAASEAVNNAIAHGGMQSDDRLCVTIEAEGRELITTFEYRGEPFPVAPPTLPAPGSPRGRGRYLMAQLTDQVSYEFFDHRTRVVLRKRIGGE